MIIEPIKNGITVTRISRKIEGLSDIDESFLEAVSNKMAVMQEMKVEINAMMSTTDNAIDPVTLVKMQALLADYSLNVDLVSKVAQRLIAGVDSLVKS